MLLAGDAASLINPLTGEGIFYAVLSGALAGAAAVGSGDPGDAYRRALGKRLGRHLTHSSTASRASRWPRLMDAVFRAASGDQRVFDDVVRLGLADGVPVSLACHWFDPARLPGILQALRTAGSITAALAAAGVPDYVRRTTRVSARMPTVAEAGLLQVARARPLLVCENTNVDTAGGVVEFCIALYPSSRVQVVFEP